MKTYVLIAETTRHADVTASQEWSWTPARRNGIRGWINDEGNFVAPALSEEHLRGRENLVIYLGYGFGNSAAYELARQLVAVGRAEWANARPVAVQ